MTVTLTYIQNQDYEGILIHYTKTVDSVKSDLNISSLTECVLKVFKKDYSAVIFSGSFTGGEIQFVDDGVNGKLFFQTQPADMSDYGQYRGEVETTLGGKSLKKQGFICNIEKESPAVT